MGVWRAIDNENTTGYRQPHLACSENSLHPPQIDTFDSCHATGTGGTRQNGLTHQVILNHRPLVHSTTTCRVRLVGNASDAWESWDKQSRKFAPAELVSAERGLATRKSWNNVIPPPAGLPRRSDVFNCQEAAAGECNSIERMETPLHPDKPGGGECRLIPFWLTDIAPAGQARRWRTSMRGGGLRREGFP